VIRAKIILLADEGLSNDVIASRLDTPRQIVSNWRSVVQVKGLAYELPHKLGLPLSRLSIEEIRQHVISQGLVAEISGAT
jgi:transposase